jgi:periplasmic copper chaperone A
MKRIRIALLLLSVAFAPTAGFSHSHKKKGLEIVHPWTRETTDQGTVNIPVFMTVKNMSRTTDRLVGASSDLADKIELIELQDHGSGKMPVATSTFVVAAGKSLQLTPAGSRLLLLGVKKSLTAFDSFGMTLMFEKAGKVEVEVMVEESDTTDPHKH